MSRTVTQLAEGPVLLGLSLKRCTNCARILHFDQFYSAKLGLGGLRAKCKPCLTEQSLDWARRNPDRVSAIRTTDRARQNNRARKQRNRAATLEAQRRANAKRRARPAERIRDRISCQIRRALGGTKGGSFVNFVDWTVTELRTHLERQFTRGMSWENMGEWHIDHIVPLSSFTITGPDDPELRRAWALPNLRPLWGRENESKGAKRLTLL